jgi:UDP-N-acetylglucosamine 2-epimerase (non-hydrolysing)/GDP/UDP-N,N'-diacetylbacillosamine 2-epimerase (hydrolysing)
MEGFAATIASFEMNIPVAHVEGGDLTEGGTHDDSIRHAMTKLAHLHFTTSLEAAERVRRLGEEEWRIVFAGLPTLDTIRRREFVPPEEICQEFSLDRSRPIVVFTQHPVSTEPERAGAQVIESLEALKAVGAQTVITYPNSDPGSQAILEAFRAYSAVPHFQFHKSLGRRRYLGLLNVARAVVGNSSSGIKETPSFGIPCVNVGSRQLGRLRAENVIDVGYDWGEIAEAVHAALFDEETQTRARQCGRPYGEGRCGEIVASRLAEVPLGERLLRKRMTY